MKHQYANYTEWKHACKTRGLKMDSFASIDCGPSENDPYETCWAFHPVPKSERDSESMLGCYTLLPDGSCEAVLFDTDDECYQWLYEGSDA